MLAWWQCFISHTKCFLSAVLNFDPTNYLHKQNLILWETQNLIYCPVLLRWMEFGSNYKKNARRQLLSMHSLNWVFNKKEFGKQKMLHVSENS